MAKSKRRRSDHALRPQMRSPGRAPARPRPPPQQVGEDLLKDAAKNLLNPRLPEWQLLLDQSSLTVPQDGGDRVE